jgi:DNA-binding MarR family transcriptional regulator
MPDNAPAHLADPADRLGYLLWQTAHLAVRQQAAALEPFGLTPAQLGVLVYTGREPGLSAAELARRVNLTPQSIQTALRPLLARGWVTRRPHPVHRRVLGNFLTPAGRTGAEQAASAAAETDARLVSSLTDDELTDLKVRLRQVLLFLNPAALDRSSLRQS